MRAPSQQPRSPHLVHLPFDISSAGSIEKIPEARARRISIPACPVGRRVAPLAWRYIDEVEVGVSMFSSVHRHALEKCVSG